MNNQHSFDEKRFEESVREFFSVRRAPFWISIGVGAVSLLGGVLSFLEYRKRNIKQRVFSFDRQIRSLQIGSGIDLSLSFGTEQQLIVEAPRRDLDGVICQLRGSRLSIRLLPYLMERAAKRKVSVKLQVEALSSITMGTGSVICADGVNRVKEFSLEQMGTGSRTLGLNVEALRTKVLLTGNFYTDLALQGGALCLSMLGEGTADLTLRKVESVECNMGGKCMVNMEGAVQYLAYRASGHTKMQAYALKLAKCKMNLSECAHAEVACEEVETSNVGDEAKLFLMGKVSGKQNIDLKDNAELVFSERML